MRDVLVEVRDLDVYYYNIKVLSKVSFQVYKGEVYALVGESGCGKTTTANAILRILPEIARVGEQSVINYYLENGDCINLLKMPEKKFSREIRWREISMVFQGAQNSLNPTLKVKTHFFETAASHGIMDKEEVYRRAYELLEAVKLDAERVLNSYPIELSGGMKQRVIIALALFLNPRFVILDEPTTALDVLVQREIISLLMELKKQFDLTYMLITHDIALVADIADRVAIMYAGRIVEESSVENIFYDPKHPYTIALLNSVPKIGDFEKLPEGLPGSPPDFKNLPRGCPFHPRCKYAMEICRKLEPSLIEMGDRRIACHLYAEEVSEE
ncbi:MAG: ABC transporter ATP-binding protein [Thermoproteota archaeon]|nr:MAG: ABC transporter ATP-binding protein [Candidatus Korarchaeota archaeon]